MIRSTHGADSRTGQRCQGALPSLPIFLALRRSDARAGGCRVYADPFGPEPACYLRDAEIGLEAEQKAELAARGEDFSFPESLTRRDPPPPGD